MEAIKPTGIQARKIPTEPMKSMETIETHVPSSQPMVLPNTTGSGTRTTPKESRTPRFMA